MLVGASPYRSKDAFATAFMHATHPTPTLPEAYLTFQPLINKALAKRPGDRYQTGEAFLSALNECELAYERSVSALPHSKTVNTSSATKHVTNEHSTRLTPPILRWSLGLVSTALLISVVLAGCVISHHVTTEKSLTTESSGTGPTEYQTVDLFSQQTQGMSFTSNNAGEANALRHELNDIYLSNIALSEAASIPEKATHETNQLTRGVLTEALENPSDHQAQPLSHSSAMQTHTHPETDSLKHQIDTLLTLANDQLNTLHITRPAGNNAHETYLAILNLDSDNQEAKQGLMRIATTYQRLAERRKDKGLLQESLDYIGRGLAIQPQHKGLLSLRNDVETKIAALHRTLTRNSEHVQEALNWIQQAEAHWLAQRLTMPSGNNALLSYRKALELDPSNQQALDGIARIVAYFRTQIEFTQDTSLHETLNNIEHGLVIMPLNHELLTLQRMIHIKLAEQKILGTDMQAMETSQH